MISCAAATMFKTDNHVNIQLITTSEIKVSCAIQSNQSTVQALRCIQHMLPKIISQLPIYLLCFARLGSLYVGIVI